MFEQNQNPAFGQAYMYGGQTPQQMQKFSNPLTAEEIEMLTKATSKFSLNITNEQRLRGICNHRTADGMGDAIVEDKATGLLKCSICGYTFRQVDSNMTADEIKVAMEQVIDLLQTVKLMFIDMPVESAREYFQIIPLLEKLPELFEIAAKNMTKHDAYGWNMRNPNMSAYAMFQNLSNIYGNGAFMGQQPMGGNPYQSQMGQPMMGGNPYQNPYMNQGGNPYMGSNGFVATGAPAYQPNNAGFAYNPGGVAQATPTTPTGPAPQQLPGEAVEVKTADQTTVQQTVKA